MTLLFARVRTIFTDRDVALVAYFYEAYLHLLVFNIFLGNLTERGDVINFLVQKEAYRRGWLN